MSGSPSVPWRSIAATCSPASSCRTRRSSSGGWTRSARGRDDEALGWYASLAELSPYDVVYLAPAHLRQGELHERRGDRQRAVAHYRAALALPGASDPAMRPVLLDLRQRVQRLTPAAPDS
jgi:hypothetical protein